jgi:two-component system, NtrC family, sensor histidine kinase PilS
MFNINPKNFLTNNKLTQKLQNLIIGRLLLTFLILVTSWVWNSGRLKLSFDDFPRDLFIVFLISVGLTIAYFIILRFNRGYVLQIRVQFFLDSLLITWLVWRTGDLTSPYITLYILLISIASAFLTARETILTALICVLLFAGLSLLVATEMLQSYGVTPVAGKIVQIIAFNAAAFLIVGLLAARLSDRHTWGEELKETTKSLANLRVLHERIIESIRSGLITTDLEGNIYTFNTSASEITGYKSEEMIGKSIAVLFGEIEKSMTDSLETTESGEQPLRHEADLMTPEGFAVRVGYSISPLFSEDGETTGLIITFQDLTEIRSMEENVRRKDRLAAVGRVAAGLAHEIRNPLGAMRGAIQVLESQTAPESSQAKLMEIILRESDRLNKIITNFLTYARPRVSNFSEIDVREAIGDTLMLLKHSPDVKENHKLETLLPPTPVMLAADPTQLKQIFWNLARNALNAMPDGGILQVETEKIASNRIRIVFSDTGCGMTPEQVERLFEPFSDSTTGGTGLGLSIVYQIIRDHSGTINVRSLENEGTTITVEFPTEIDHTKTNGNEDETGENEYKSSRLESFLKVNK